MEHFGLGLSNIRKIVCYIGSPIYTAPVITTIASGVAHCTASNDTNVPSHRLAASTIRSEMISSATSVVFVGSWHKTWILRGNMSFTRSGPFGFIMQLEGRRQIEIGAVLWYSLPWTANDPLSHRQPVLTSTFPPVHHLFRRIPRGRPQAHCSFLLGACPLIWLLTSIAHVPLPLSKSSLSGVHLPPSAFPDQHVPFRNVILQPVMCDWLGTFLARRLT